MTSKLRTGELTKTLNLITKAGLDLNEIHVRFLKFCQETGYGKLSGVLLKGGAPVMADEVRRDVRFDIEGAEEIRPWGEHRQWDNQRVEQLLARIEALLVELQGEENET